MGGRPPEALHEHHDGAIDDESVVAHRDAPQPPANIDVQPVHDVGCLAQHVPSFPAAAHSGWSMSASQNVGGEAMQPGGWSEQKLAGW